MRTRARALSLILSALSLAPAATGCVLDTDAAIASDQDEILGSFDFIDGSCTASQQAFFRDAGFVARVVVTSPAFEGCVRARIPANYRRCTGNGSDGDPNVSTAQHITNALAATRSVNDLKMNCNPADGVWGRAGLGTTPGYYGDERFTYGATSISAPSLPYPTGLKEVAATIIHENMHQHGYWHNPGCNDPSINDVVNTMPWLVDQCLIAVVDESMSRCTDICQGRVGTDLTACRTRGRLRLVTALGGSTCADSYDPGVSGLGALQVRSRELIALDMLPHGKTFSGSASAPVNRSNDYFLARGDFDPYQPGEEMLFEYATSGIRTGWNSVGWDVRGSAAERTTFAATRLYPNNLDLSGAPAGTLRWMLYTDTVVLGVGRFSSAAQWGVALTRDELLVRSPDGLGVLAVSGNFRTRNRMPFGTVLTGAGTLTWTVGANDAIMAIADLNGDAQADLLVKNATRIGILSRTGADGTWKVLDARDIVGATGFYGFWDIGGSDTIVATGDFVGDAREEVLIRSPWGIAILGMPVGSSTLRDLWGAANGTVIASRWTLRATDAIRFSGRFASSTKKSVVLTGTDGLANLSWTTSGATVTAAVPQLTPASGGFFLDPDVAGGFWAYGPTNQLLAMGDFDGDGRDSLMIKSGWGYGIIGPSASASAWFLHDSNPTECGPASEVACNNGLYGSWLARETDSVVTVLKDSTGASSLILRSRP